MPKTDWFSLELTGALLNKSRATVRRMAGDGRLTGDYDGKIFKIDPQSVIPHLRGTSLAAEIFRGAGLGSLIPSVPTIPPTSQAVTSSEPVTGPTSPDAVPDGTDQQ